MEEPPIFINIDIYIIYIISIIDIYIILFDYIISTQMEAGNKKRDRTGIGYLDLKFPKEINKK